MSDDERIEQLELENKVLKDNNKGLKAKIDELQKELDKSNERLDMCIDLLNLEGCLNFDTKQEKLDDIDRLVEIDKASYFKHIFPENECIRGYFCEKVEEENE